MLGAAEAGRTVAGAATAGTAFISGEFSDTEGASAAPAAVGPTGELLVAGTRSFPDAAVGGGRSFASPVSTRDSARNTWYCTNAVSFSKICSGPGVSEVACTTDTAPPPAPECGADGTRMSFSLFSDSARQRATRATG